MAVVVDIDGERREVSDSRVLRMLKAIARRADEIAAIRFGAVSIDFGSPAERLKVRLTKAERE